MRFTITEAKEKDAREICQLIRRSISEVCGPDYAKIDGFIENWLANKTPENIGSWIKSTEGVFIICRNDESIVGVANMNRQGKILL